MAPKFGTSGLRGLVTALTSSLVQDHVRAFIAACDVGKGLFVGQDLRPSSLRLAQDIVNAAHSMGVRVTECGPVPTPALALAALDQGSGAIMVTGSHIPADRNGLKFYTPRGEITKSDETAITQALGIEPKTSASRAYQPQKDADVGARFVARYVQACGPGSLAGRQVGLYSHSAVGRDLMADILRALGANVIELGRSAHFIPVDTEAVDPDTRSQIAGWVRTHSLDALVSMDGDSDRPLLADETGRIVPGDILGQITAQSLGAEAVVTPISSNSGVAQKGFDTVALTAIGSPHVIAGMQQQGGKVVGYEANGGFLLGFEAAGPAGHFAPLVTRDCVLPLIMTLLAARGGTVSQRVAQEPPVVTVADRLQNIPQTRAQPFVASLAKEAQARANFLAVFDGQEATCNLTDGVRMTLVDGRVVHVRPSGNAPELRLYIEASDPETAAQMLDAGLRHLAQNL